MNRKLFITAFLMLLCSTMFGQWKWQAPAPNEFEHSMDVAAIIKINGVTDARENLELAAFCDGAVRGTTKTQKITINNEEVAFAFINIYGNHNNDDIKFKLYVPSTNGTDEGKVLVTDYIVSFRSGSIIGNITPEVIDFYESHWSCDVVFNNTMTVGCTINIDGVPYKGTDVEIAAFCNGEVCGVGRPVYWEETGQYYTELIVGKLVEEGNQDATGNDIISFKLYHPEYGVLNTDYTVQFKDGETIVDENNQAISIDFLNEAEAQIKRNGVYRYFTTLVKAVENAQAGETIELLKDIEEDDVVLIDKSLTIDGKGHNVTSSASRVFRVTTSNVSVVMNDVDVVSSAKVVYPNDVRGIAIDPSLTNVELTLNNCSVEFTDSSANDWAYAVNVAGNGTEHKVTVNGGTYEGANVINVYGAKNTIVVTNATITSTYPNNDQYYGACIWVLQKQNSSVEATGNTFNGSNAIAFNLGTGNTLTESNNIDNTKYVVAKIGNEYYTSLVDAFAAVKNGETIKVLQNISLAETVKVNNQITLDLNGKTITGTDNATASFALIEIQPGKELKVVGNGTITLTATNNRQFNAFSSVISNQRGKLVVENGTIEHLGGTDMAYAIDNLTNTGSQKAETEINGGTIKSPYRAIRQFLNSSAQGVNNILTVNGGTIEGTNKSIWMQDANANANPGELTVSENASLKGDVYLSVTAGSTEWPVEVMVKAAALKNDSKVLTNNNEPECYDIKIKDGAWVVYFGVAKIGDTLYETLAEALSAAANNATVNLLWKEGDAPIAMNGTVVGNKTVTITGKANVDWNKGWFFVGRGGEGNGKVIFDNAMLTSVSNSNTYGFNVSGSKKNDNNTNDGVIEIKNSTIVLDYMLNKGTMSLDKSTLTVKNGFSVTGRLAKESATGVDATATMTLSNESKLVVNNINGMGVGHEAYGVMNIDASSIFEATQNFLVAPKGTMNIAGNAIVAEGKTLTNNGTIVLTDINATLTSNECGNVTTNVADHVVAYINGTYTLNAAVAKIGETPYATLQKAVNAVKNGETIVLLSDITENVTLTEKVGLYYTIDGKDMTMNGKIVITPLSDENDNRRITIKNIKFVNTADAAVDFISCAVTNHYPRLTVEGCTFTGNGKNTDVALRLKTAYGAVIKDCTGTGLHSFIQNVAGLNLTIEKVTVTNSKSGFALGTVQGVTVKGCEADVEGYGIRMDANTYNNNAVIESNTIKAFIPVVVRNVNTDSNITFQGTNKFTANNTDNLWCAIGATEYEANGQMPTAPDTGKVRVEIVNSDNLPQSGLYGNHVKGTHSAAYVGTDGYWGECGGWANYSFELKFYNGDTFMGSTSLNDVGNIIDGDVYVSWNMKLDAASNNDPYWTMAWDIAPTIAMQPNRVEQWVDGVKVAESAIQLNGPDNLNPIVAAVADKNGTIVSFKESLEEAVAAGDNVAILRAGTYNIPTGKDLTITATVDGVVFDNIGAKNMGGANVTFNNVTFTYANNSTYKGLQHAGNLVYNNCTFNGQVFLYGQSETFNGCTFNQTTENYNVWTYGANKVAFNECTFNSAGKSVLIYAESASIFNNVTVTACTFNASKAVEGKAAIEMDSSLTSGINLTISNTTATSFGNGNVSGNSLWNNKKGNADAANNDITVVVDGETVLEPIHAAQICDVIYPSLQSAVNAVKNGEEIVLLSDITENVTLTEKVGLYYTIDGKGKNMTGTITVSSLSDTDDNRRITIKNINFVDTVNGRDFITSVNNNHYPRLTVEGCSFTGTGKATANTVAIRLKSSHSVVITDCTGTGLHSFLQNTSGWNLTIEKVTVTDSKSGLALGTVQGVTIKGSNIDVAGYGIRMDANIYNNNAIIESNIVKAFIPVVVRDANSESNITFKGTNTMNQTNDDDYWCVIGKTEYEKGVSLENGFELATGKVIVALNDSGLNIEGVYGNYYEATIGGTQYIALKDAFNAAVDGNEIVVARDITIDEAFAGYSDGTYTDGVRYNGDKSFTVNFNGKTVTDDGCVNDYLIYINNKGTKDNVITFTNGTIVSKNGCWSTICVGASTSSKSTTLNLNDITIINSNGSAFSGNLAVRVRGNNTVNNIVNVNENTTIISDGASYGVGCLTDGAIVNINKGAKVEQKNSGTSGGNNVYTAVGGNGVINIYDGATIVSDRYGVHTMTTGTPVVNIMGGTITAPIALKASTNGGSGQVATINVSGGTITGALEEYTVNGHIILTGGTFDRDVNEYCAEYYTAIYDPATARYNVVLSGGVQTRELVEGWSWFSTYIDSETLLQDLKAELHPNGIQIKGQDGYTQFYSGYGANGAWSPGLTSVSPTKMYMIKTNAYVEVTLEGNFVEENREITLNPGWNWIGYPVRETVYVLDAIENIRPTHGDVIKSQNASAVYSPLFNQWVVEGEFDMNPGEGYMYYSNATQNFDFSYSKTGSSAKTSSEPVEYHWIANASQYSSNMTMIAMLNIDGKIVKDNYEIAAFANGECRGSARPIYVEAIDTYVLVMTISGEEVELLTFKYYDVNNGSEYELSNRVNYSSDAILGTAEEPYMLTLDITGIGENSLNDINIYPNPTTTDRAINLQATCDYVEVFNALGVKVAEYHNVDSIDALETAGIYVIRVTINGEVKNCRLVVK